MSVQLGDPPAFRSQVPCLCNWRNMLAPGPRSQVCAARGSAGLRPQVPGPMPVQLGAPPAFRSQGLPWAGSASQSGCFAQTPHWFSHQPTGNTKWPTWSACVINLEIILGCPVGRPVGLGNTASPGPSALPHACHPLRATAQDPRGRHRPQPWPCDPSRRHCPHLGAASSD